MRGRQRSPILQILKLAVVGYVFWQVWQLRIFDSGGIPAPNLPAMFGLYRVIFLGAFLIISMHILYPLVARAIGSFRSRPWRWEPIDRFVIPDAETPPDDARTCPDCGVPLVDDSSDCPRCGHRMA